MNISRHLATIDLLRAQPFPAQAGCPSVGRGSGGSSWVESGPGFHLADLAVSGEFEDADVVRVREVEEEFEAELLVLVEVLTRRWGEPEVVWLADHLEQFAMGEPVRPPLDALCGFVSQVYAWRVDGRWIGLGVGRGGQALPFQLVVGIGEPDVR
ncbi:hypothetical protein [Streptomyces sp. KR80]|uniref:hypothetical protein n=1 Tax=Streptomyces sp. KR80 TaxID=3457426 RepID=UPI003FD16895